MSRHVIFVHGIGIDDAARRGKYGDVRAGWPASGLPSFLLAPSARELHAAGGGERVWDILNGTNGATVDATRDASYFLTYYGPEASAYLANLRGAQRAGLPSNLSCAEAYAFIVYDLVKKIVAAGERPIIVAHSLGGLVVRYMMHNLMRNDTSDLERIVFVGSPQQGIGDFRAALGTLVSTVGGAIGLFSDAINLDETSLRRAMGVHGQQPFVPANDFLPLLSVQSGVTATKVTAISHTLFDLLVDPASAHVQRAPRSYLSMNVASTGMPGGINIHDAICTLMAAPLEEALRAHHRLVVDGRVSIPNVSGIRANSTIQFAHVLVRANGERLSAVDSDFTTIEDWTHVLAITTANAGFYNAQWRSTLQSSGVGAFCDFKLCVPILLSSLAGASLRIGVKSTSMGSHGVGQPEYFVDVPLPSVPNANAAMPHPQPPISFDVQGTPPGRMRVAGTSQLLAWT